MFLVLDWKGWERGWDVVGALLLYFSLQFIYLYIFILHHSLVSVEKWSYFYQSILIKVLTDV